MFLFIEQPDNDFIAQEVAKFPDHLIGFACINPWTKNASGDNPFSMPHQFEEMAKTSPKVMLIIAHAGRLLIKLGMPPNVAPT